MIIVDTSVWVDFLDGTENSQTKHLSESLKSEIPIFYTGLILQEVLYTPSADDFRKHVAASQQQMR